jgi:hypothetical protein
MSVATAERKQQTYEGLLSGGLAELRDTIAAKKAEAEGSRRNRLAGHAGRLMFGKNEYAPKVVSGEVVQLGRAENIVNSSLKITEKALAKDKGVKSAEAIVVAGGDKAVGLAFANDKLLVSVMSEQEDGTIEHRSLLVGEDGIDTVKEGPDILDGRELSADELITSEEFMRLTGSAETDRASAEAVKQVIDDLHYFKYAGPDIEVSAH